MALVHAVLRRHRDRLLELDWQALLGLGYSFGWGDVSLSIRSLSYDFSDKDATCG